MRILSDLKVTSFSLILLGAFFLHSVVAREVYDFDNEDDRERFQKFTYELRCPTCQSQNLAGSDAVISIDLKRELHRLITEGKNDDEIIEFMLNRYGDFVLYKPRFTASNYVLWFAPAILLLLGGFVFYRILKSTSAAEDE